MSAQIPDLIEIGGERRPLLPSAGPTPVAEPHPEGLRVSFDSPSPSLYRGYRALWRVREGGLYLVALDGYGAILPPGQDRGRIAMDWFTLADLHGGEDPVPATWVTGTAQAAWDLERFSNSPLGMYCGTWRVLDFREGVLVGDRFAAGRARPGDG